MARILVVDDESSVRQVLTTCFRRAGHECGSLPDALPLVEGDDLHGADLIVLDLAMPTPGETAIRALRRRGCDLPIVVLSGVMDEKSVDEVMALGATRVLEKPVRLMHLLALVDLLLAGSGAAAEDRDLSPAPAG